MTKPMAAAMYATIATPNRPKVPQKPSGRWAATAAGRRHVELHPSKGIGRVEHGHGVFPTDRVDLCDGDYIQVVSDDKDQTIFQ
jgi:hypothetical protein